MQSKYQSIMEQTLNVGSGFIISVLVWEFIIKNLIYGGVLSVDSSIMITIIFTVVSFIRGYLWRRFFNKLSD